MTVLKLMGTFTVVVTLIFALSMAGCSHQPVSETEARQQILDERQAFLNQIADSQRRVKLLDELKILQQELVDLNHTVDRYSAATKKLNQNYDATRAEFQQLLEAFNLSRKQLQDRILSAHFAIKNLTTEKEWKSIAKLEQKAVLDYLKQNLLQRMKTQEKILVLRFNVKDQMTRQEWQSTFGQ